jgi:anti-sigma regulatory factor (Ser/Thr protein kinase)
MSGTGDSTTLTDRFGLDLPFSAESARVARQHLLAWLEGHADEERRDDARLLVSELVGNAVRHARPLADGTACAGLPRTAPSTSP